jgi:hypothetical protein
MGANLLVVTSTLLLPLLQQDTTTTDQPSGGLAYERLSDLLQYNRVQGLSFGLGYGAALPVSRSAVAYATVRYGLSDERITWRLTAMHQSLASRLVLSGYYDVIDLDPFSTGRTIANTVNAIFAGHDNGDYALARGGSATWEGPVGKRLELVLGTRIEHHDALGRIARSAVNDWLGGTGLFPPNPPVREGTLGIGWARLRGIGRISWKMTLEAWGGAGQTRTRLFGDARQDFGESPGITLRLKAGAGSEPALPQTLFRLGGLNTVRGFEYAASTAPALWAAQLDITPFRGQIRPVLFVDAGQASRVATLFSTTALVGGGAGLSLLNGLIRLDFSRPISPGGNRKLRFDLVIEGAR